MFVRIFRPAENSEMLLNVNHVWKIDISYVVGEGPDYWATSLQDGLKDPEAKRVYEVFIGSEVVRLVSKPDDPVVKVFEQIYRDAVKG